MSKWDEIWQYVISICDIPICVHEGLALFFCLGTALFMFFYGFKKGSRYLLGLLLVEYVVLLLCSTVIFRNAYETSRFEIHPFWSYTQDVLFIDNIMNVIVFMPIGFLTGITSKERRWWKVLLIGGGISLMIEIMQYLYNRGLAETDDVMHNILGCMIGYGLLTMFVKEYEKFLKGASESC